MRIPIAATPADAFSPFAFLASKADGKPRTGDWASFIGIVTAICGNVLISIALNTQRYAHIKLSQQYQERRRLLRRAKRRAGTEGGYGTTSTENNGVSGKERARQHLNEAALGAEEGYRDEEEEEGTEDQPLLSSSMYSENTATPEGEEEAEDADEVAQKSYLKSPYWWAGIVMMTIGEAGNFLAYGFAPASIVSPLGVVALISNCIIAPFFLKERFRKRDFLGLIIAVAGAVTVVLSASDSNPKLGPKEIWKLISTWEFETYLGITVALIIGLMWASSRYGEKSIFIDLGLVGLLGGYTALSTKGVASMFSYTIFKALTYPITYLLIFILVSTAIMQIKYVNRALKRFDATQVIPTQFVMFTLSVIIGSAVLYRDFEKESAEDAGKFIGGCAMTFLGVYFITSARGSNEEEEEDFEEDDEAIRLAGEVYQDDPEAARPEVRRTSTAPINGNRPLPRHQLSASPPNYMSVQAPTTPAITRTSTNQSPALLDSDFSDSDSDSLLPEPSPLTEYPWTAPEEQSSETRKGIQKLLKPLNKLLPQEERNKIPSTLKSTNSTPILPTEASYHPERPQTPIHASYAHEDTLRAPVTPQDVYGGARLSRHSSLIPGPLTATLSSPLSAIVADSLRRGVDMRSLKPKRRRLPGLIRPDGSLQPQRGNSETDSPLFPQGDSSGSLPIVDGEAEAEEGRQSRIRSLSITFGELFKSKSRTNGKRGDSAAEDEEQPPDGRPL